MKAQIQECPHCGSSYGFYDKGSARGIVYTNYNFDGTPADNAELHDSLNYQYGKIAYCLGCHKKIASMEEMGIDV